MEKFFTTSKTVELPLSLPEKAIWSRLGRNRFLSQISAHEEVRFKLAMHRAFALCRPRGRWRLLEVENIGSGQIRLERSLTVESDAFADFAGQSKYLFLGGVTIGDGVNDLINRSQDNLSEAAIYDALGSEVADQAIGMLQKIAAGELSRYGLQLGARRFSPGYGNLRLDAVQPAIFKWLDLETLGMTLTESCIMQPEKSVTAFACADYKE